MIDVESYCRDLEAFLCRKNDGHLIRISGPAFEQVMGWARQGIPLKVAEAGIDRYFERYYRKGPRRRPVRIEFCEADVFDAFDDWRRAVGIAAVAPDVDGGPDVEEPSPASARSTTIARIAARGDAGTTHRASRERQGRARCSVPPWRSRCARSTAASRCARARAANRATGCSTGSAAIDAQLVSRGDRRALTAEQRSASKQKPWPSSSPSACA